MLRRGSSRFMTSLAIVLSVGLVLPASAAADIYHQVLSTYEAHGSIPPCRFSSSQLDTALRSIDAYGQQYFADFTDAIDNALADRASGACMPGGIKARSRRSALAAGAGALPPSVTSATSAGVPAPMLLLGAMALLGLVATIVVWATRVIGWQPRWASGWRHGWAEAGYRMAARRAWISDALRTLANRSGIGGPNRHRSDR